MQAILNTGALTTAALVHLQADIREELHRRRAAGGDGGASYDSQGAPNPLAARFCVIGLKCQTSIDRTWLPTEAAAIGHAKHLIGKYPAKNQIPLGVVQLAKVVGPVVLPIMARDPLPEDTQ